MINLIHESLISKIPSGDIKSKAYVKKEFSVNDCKRYADGCFLLRRRCRNKFLQKDQKSTI
ncbi:hypothetical protein C1M59_02595 [Vibrio diazotrophicus]|nr:hypothetical protein C1M59_02595 [Vibrio diazotrophicus]